jgi:hypothetical protein
MKINSKFLVGAALLILSLIGSRVARAQDQGSTQDPNQVAPQASPQDQNNGPDQGATQEQQDPNAPGMARISMIHGNVSTQRGDSGDVTAATLNTPVAPGDKVTTGNDSRAEIQLDFANVLRLADNSSANIAALDAKQIQIQIGDGLAYFSQFKGSEASVEIDTPNVAIHPTDKENGFSIFVNSGGQTEVTVRKGELEMTTPQGSTRVRAGQMITVQGTGNDVQYKVSDAPSKTDWDTFNQDRDRLIQHADSWKHTDRYYTGTQDLDAYGKWTEVPDYGQVWVPNTAPGWTPYSAGSWVWEPYWGWTWTSSEPWGWAPYHYGRWFVNGGGWAWWPGPVYGGFGLYRPIWAPAYVSFFGFGGGFGVGIGFGSFGWLPIGPCDFFHPWWGGYRNRFGAVGFASIHEASNFRGGWGPLHGGDRFSNIHSVWTNDRVRQGLSTVPANGFGHGAVHPTPASFDTLRTARGMTGNLPVVPSRESLSASGRFQSTGANGARGGSQKFFSTHTPAARTESFSAQASHMQSAIQNNGHFSPVDGAADARRSVAVKTSPSFGSNGNDARGNRSNDRPSSSPNTPSGMRTQAPPSNGYERFGSANGANGTANTSRPPASSPSTDRTWRPPSSSGSPNTTTRQYSAPPTYRPSTGYGSANTYRPPLQMNKPIVTQRSYGNNGSYGRPSTPSRPPSYSSGGNRAPSGGSRPPSGGGNHSAAPRLGSSHPSGGGSHGSSGGGHSHGH